MIVETITYGILPFIYIIMLLTYIEEKSPKIRLIVSIALFIILLLNKIIKKIINPYFVNLILSVGYILICIYCANNNDEEYVEKELLFMINIVALLYLVITIYKKHICGQSNKCLLCKTNYTPCGYNINSENCELNRSATNKFEMVITYLLIIVIMVATTIYMTEHIKDLQFNTNNINKKIVSILFIILIILCIGILFYCPFILFSRKLLSNCVKNNNKDVIHCEFKVILQKIDKSIIYIPMILSCVFIYFLLDIYGIM